MKKKLLAVIIVLLLVIVGSYYIYNTKNQEPINSTTKTKIEKASENNRKVEDSKENKGIEQQPNNDTIKDSNKNQRSTSIDNANNNNTNLNNNNNSNSNNTNENPLNNNSINNSNTNNEAINNSSDFMNEVEQLIFKLVNEERAKANLSPLSYNSSLEKYARIKSQDMGNRAYFSHEDPEGKYITDKMKEDGFSYSAWAENIAYLSENTDANYLANTFMNNWMNSSGHRANILTNNCTSIGIGVCSINGKVYATQEFCR